MMKLNLAFLSYGIRYIFFGPTKQRLLLLVVSGLVLSSFSLLVLQSTMGGLQRNLMKRSQDVNGVGVIFLQEQYQDQGKALGLVRELAAFGVEAYPEYEIELLLKNGKNMSYGVVHGMSLKDRPPQFLRKRDIKEGVASVGIVNRLKINYGQNILMISPAHTNDLWGEIPRHVTLSVGDIINNNVPEIDMFHIWTRDSIVHNLIRGKSYNRIRIYHWPPEGREAFIQRFARDYAAPTDQKVRLETWEEQNSSLVWALNLESTVMIGLFSGMTLLVGVMIMSGLMIFFDKIQKDLVTFWMLGLTRKKIIKLVSFFVHCLSFFSSLLGLGLGFLFLYMLKVSDLAIMPDIFLDQKMPISITWKGVGISFFIPCFLSYIFSKLSLSQFKKDQRPFTQQLKSMA
jgi:lipoprotein-releasing system permease protein